MRWHHKLWLRHKITYLIMVNSFVALCVAGIAFAEYGLHRFKAQQTQDLNALANIMGTNSTAALEFKDPNSARDVLRALAVKPHILAACIYDLDGKPFAVYHRGASKEIYSPPPVESEASRFTSDRVLIFQKITLDGEKIGNVFLEGDTVEYQQLLESYLLFFALIVMAAPLGFAFAERLQRLISNPILDLARTARMVAATRDYSIRAGKQSEDEVGVLTDAFNEMLAQIQKRDAELLERVEGDHELLAEMIHLFLREAPRLLEAMRNALQQGDMLELERSAHSMKGAAGHLSAQAMASAALQLEQNAKNGDAESAKTSLAMLEGAVERLLPVLADSHPGVSQ